MKKSIKTDSDSLVYEYIAGKYFINEVSNYYPNFVLTYDLLTANRYTNDLSIIEINKKVVSTLISVKDENDNQGQPKLHELIKNSCMNEIENLLLIQMFKSVLTFQLFFEKQLNNTVYNQIALPSLMYQVYFTLSQICDKFTHYDLHTNNVLVYQLPTDKYIKLKYHTNNRVITLNTQHIPKIIDYGRCFFYESDTVNSMNIKNILCSVKECNTHESCGEYHGFAFFDYDSDTMKADIENYYISSPLRNISHDLVFANYIKMQYNYSNKPNKVLEKILDNTICDSQFGTPERQSEQGSREYIYNVIDMKEELEEKIIGTSEYQKLIALLYSNLECICTIHIYEKMTKKMEFIHGSDE